MERYEIQGTYFNIIKKIYSKPIVTNREKFKAISLKSGTRQDCLFLHIYSRWSIYIIVRTKGQLKERVQTGKEEVKVSVFADDMIVYTRYPKNFSREILQSKNTFRNVDEYTNNNNNKTNKQ